LCRNLTKSKREDNKQQQPPGERGEPREKALAVANERARLIIRGCAAWPRKEGDGNSQS